MTGMPTGEVEVDSAEGAEVDEVADGTAAADACWSTAVGDSPGGEVSVGVDRGELTCVHVSRPVPGPLGGLGLTARSTACAYTEPSGP